MVLMVLLEYADSLTLPTEQNRVLYHLDCGLVPVTYRDSTGTVQRTTYETSAEYLSSQWMRHI